MFYGTVCIIKNNKDQILLLKRSPNKKLFPNMWAIVSAGPYKSPKDAKSNIKEEIFLEAGIKASKLSEGNVFKTKLGKNDWKIYPYLISVDSNQPITLNEEHTEYKWVNKNELKNYEFPTGMAAAIRSLL